ncbi:MAG TPA: UPF0262 family protein [Alphaproteobacteria bacterium]|nr:UPF0262 family protein [Alphaproteobacteria bacterium]
MTEQSGKDKGRCRISQIHLDEHSIVRWSPDVEHERAVAVFDLLEENYFALVGDFAGPFVLRLSISESRLVMAIHDEGDAPLTTVNLPTSPFRKIIKDYFTVCESYYAAIRRASPSKIEAIDMGRRALHNEGSELLKERLSDKIDVDLNTARRLFTLLCVLHIRG